MRWLFLVLLSMACGDPPPPAEPPVSTPTEPTSLVLRQEITVEDLHAKHAAGIELIDVRTHEEFVSGHVAGAKNVPLDLLDPTMPPIADLPKDKPIYVICEVGARSSLAAKQLASAGFQAVNVSGGTEAWRAKGYPVE